MFSTHAFVQIQGNARRQKESMNHQSLMPSLASLGKIDPSDFFLGCENEGLKLEVRHLNYLVYLMKKN